MTAPSTDLNHKQHKKQKKQERRNRREDYQHQLSIIDPDDIQARNDLMTEICQSLNKTTKVFEARWKKNDPITIDVLKNTPLFWFKKHKWGYKDVKELYKICSIKKQNLESDLSVVYAISAQAKERKRRRTAQMEDKHLRRESIVNLRTLRDHSLTLMKHRSIGNIYKDEFRNREKIDGTGLKIWQYLSKSKPQPCEQLTYDQFNIGLNDNQIKVDPDLSLEIFYEIFHVMQKLDKHNRERNQRKKKAKERRAGGGQSPMNSALLINISMGGKYLQHHMIVDTPSPPSLSPNTDYHGSFPETKEKELTTLEKMKFIKKKTITMSNIQRLLRFISKNIKREDLLTLPKNVSPKKKYLVIFHKIFDSIKNQQQFDVQNDYLLQRLTTDTLNNYIQILEILETRNADWKDRLQVLEYLESNLESNELLSPLFESENCLHLLLGWTSQMYDARSNLTKVAAELFPSLLSQLIGGLDIPAIIFEEEHQLIRSIFESLFVLLKNGRSKTLSDIAHDVLIQIIEMLAMIAQDLDETAYARMIHLLYEKSQYVNEKHDKVRGGCMIYSLFLLYGTEGDTVFELQPMLKYKSLNDMECCALSKSDDESKVDESVSDGQPNVKNVKMAKKCKRPFLFENEEFMNILGKTVEEGVGDRSKDAREGAMKILRKIEVAEKEQSVAIFDRFFDEMIIGKYLKWKKYNLPKKGKKGKKGKKRQKINRRALRANTVQHSPVFSKEMVAAKSVPLEEIEESRNIEENQNN